MRFNENANGFIAIKNIKSTLIYFFFNNKEVVYIGQTKLGLSRPFSHNKNKDFDEIVIIKTDENLLDFYEDKYIEKYKPIYNKQSNMLMRYSFERVKKSIRQIEGYEKFNLRMLKKTLNILGIEYKQDYFSNFNYIYCDEFEKVKSYLENNKNKEQ